MKVIAPLTFLLTVTSSLGSLRGHNRRLDDLVLFAKYDWENGAKDVSGSTINHKGTLSNDAKAEGGTLTVCENNGVDLGIMPELDLARKVRFEFEDVKITDLPSDYSVLLGGGEHKWWVALDIHGPDGPTDLVFNVGGWGGDTNGHNYDYRVTVSPDVVLSFDKIECQFDGSEPTDSRLAIRFDGGEWSKGGWIAKDFPDFYDTFPTSNESVLINDGGRADWDDICGLLGTVSLYASQPLFQYKAFKGACRMNEDGSGTGRNGDEYDLYKREDNPAVDYHWCKDRCDQSDDCTGFEYRDSWMTSQCEIWTEFIRGYEDKDELTCLVKVV